MPYLNSIYGDNASGWLAVWHKSTKQTRWFSTSELSTAEHYMLMSAANDDVYFGWGLQRENPERGRGASATVAAVPGVMMDIDLKADAPGIHANSNLPRSVDEMVSLIEEIGFLMPTQVRHSGNGTYGDWLYSELWQFASDKERSHWAAAGFTDTKFRCHDGTGGGLWDAGYSAASSSLRR